MSQMLPFVEDTSGQRLKRYKDFDSRPRESETPQQSESNTSKDHPSIVSLSFDQVNNDTDELIGLRGEGRYFGVTDPDDAKSDAGSGPLCDNCHKRGHKRANCKVVICHKCGKVGDHYETHCPTTLICLRCGERGHYVADCKSKTRKKQYCRTCDSFQHGDENCPTIWRSYLTIGSSNNSNNNNKNESKSSLPNIYCYNCASSQHYGDECPQQRSSRVPNLGSAFSGNNLPKQLRSLYFSSLRKSYSNHTDEDYDPSRSSRNFASFGGYSVQANNGASSQGMSGSGGGSRNYSSKYQSSYKPLNYTSNNYGSADPRGSSFGNGRGGYDNQSYSGTNSGSQGQSQSQSQSYSNGNNSRVIQSTRSGSLKSKNRNPSPGPGKITKPTRSGLIDRSKKAKKGKHIRY
ncbi:uncharacterized protein LODBEIA_P07260 [Lodderomyces beijingensis]|uniref:CCHC-type domain-containing protein n=1 Tax=Lodderomyces beijingensis TaxID=1775926 RepID=A0ABP0ZGH1_9ASCO